MKDVDIQIANKIKMQRNLAEISLPDFAVLTGIEEKKLKNYEEAKQEIVFDDLGKICDCLKISLGDLFDFTQDIKTLPDSKLNRAIKQKNLACLNKCLQTDKDEQ